jgi:hypothetical protein
MTTVSLSLVLLAAGVLVIAMLALAFAVRPERARRAGQRKSS